MATESKEATCSKDEDVGVEFGGAAGAATVARTLGAGAGGASLQDRFLAYRRQKQQAARMQKAKASAARDAAFKERLRRKFVEQAKKYLGVPYKQKYHEPGTEHYDAPLYLDCCGLVRRVMDDLQDDFGFRIGRWNQAYMFDTLPAALELSEMKPGDLVFYTGTFYSSKSKKQIHDVVHVEIFTGGETGEETIAARYQKGVVKFFDSYRFESKLYHSIVFHLRSLDTWLEGVCKSHCAEHEWKITQWSVDKRSVFYEGEGQSAGGDSDDDAEEEDA